MCLYVYIYIHTVYIYIYACVCIYSTMLQYVNRPSASSSTIRGVVQAASSLALWQGERNSIWYHHALHQCRTKLSTNPCKTVASVRVHLLDSCSSWICCRLACAQAELFSWFDAASETKRARCWTWRDSYCWRATHQWRTCRPWCEPHRGLASNPANSSAAYPAGRKICSESKVTFRIWGSLSFKDSLIHSPNLQLLLHPSSILEATLSMAMAALQLRSPPNCPGENPRS